MTVASGVSNPVDREGDSRSQGNGSQGPPVIDGMPSSLLSVSPASSAKPAGRP